MPIMRHGETATEIFDLNLNRGCCDCGCHVDVTNIMNTVVVIIIGDDSMGNRLIRSVLLDEFLDKNWHCTVSSVNMIRHDDHHWWIWSCSCTSDIVLWMWASDLKDIALGACERRGNRPWPPKTLHLPWSCPSRYHEVHEQECAVDGECEMCQYHLAKPYAINWSLNCWRVGWFESHVSRICSGSNSWRSLLTTAIQHRPDPFP
jgi:hypothetical protein